MAHPVIKWMGATLDGLVEPTGAVFEAKFMLPWNFSEEAAAEKHMAQLQHNMWVANARSAALSIITGGGKWVELTHPCRSAIPAPACSPRRRSSGAASRMAKRPGCSGSSRRDRGWQAVRTVDMSDSNSWAELAGVYRRTQLAHQEHEGAKAELKKLVPEDAREATGHGLKARRSKSGAISFEALEPLEAAHAAQQ